METKYYVRKNGPVTPLTIAVRPGTYSLETAAMNLLRMELMDGKEGTTAEQSFKMLMEIPFQERMKRIHEYEWGMKGSDPELRWMYDRAPYLDQEDEMVPVEKVYRELTGQPELTDEEINQYVTEMLEEYPLSPFLDENAGPEYWD